MEQSVENGDWESEKKLNRGPLEVGMNLRVFFKFERKMARSNNHKSSQTNIRKQITTKF